MKAISSFSLYQYINESNLMHISDIYHVYSRYIPDISHYSLYHHITLKDGRIILQKNRSVHCTYSSKQYMYSNGWNPGFIQKNYSGYIPGIFLAYPREKYIPGIYLVYTRKNISGDSRWPVHTFTRQVVRIPDAFRVWIGEF